MKQILLVLPFLVAACATSPGHQDDLASQVSGLVDQTTEKNTEQTAFAALETLGSPGVPYMIGHLDDMRPLPERDISLANTSPDAFEGMRHYSPETVHDALAAILNQITGQSFIAVYNGASPSERQIDTDRWRSWCAANFPTKAAACHAR
ncbi:hypothetical protein [Rhodanobacter sp. DHB23]|uniref:hypothetical protein n=1 Tax=Rhodanobacter sp. DHB23 TaxID=2775923 RepID=UPI001783058B|nr:hypothetical protein [Rhodanobacter sp. DHB23]MBD8871967.1 hypothetical protein [Rhodanobacter sp. DHB23]